MRARTGRSAYAETVLVAEGESDALAAIEPLADSAHVAHVEVVGIPGTGFLVDRLAAELIDLGTRTVYLALDGDDAGREYAERASAALREAGIRQRCPTATTWPAC